MENGSDPVNVGGLIYLSGVVGTNDAGTLAGPDVASQARRALAHVGEELQAAGSSLAMAVSVDVILKRAQDFDAMNAVYRDVFAVDPPVRTTIVGDVPGSALVQVSVIAVPIGATRDVLTADGWAKPAGPSSYVIRTDDLVFLSGLVARPSADAKIKMVAGTTAQQTKAILHDAGDLLAAAELTYDDVVAARVFVTDDSYFEQMNDTYRGYFPKDPPARATLVAGLVNDDARVQVTFIAATRGKTIIGPSLSPTLPVSAAVRTGSRVFLSGVLGDTDANEFDPAAQTREALGKLSATLAADGLSFDDVVDSTIYVRRIEDADKILGVYRELVPHGPPATVLGTRLVPRAALVEVLLTVHKQVPSPR